MADGLSNDVFVSYRRDVSQYLAMALWQNLTERGIDVFFDLESIHAGQFESIILAQIAARPYMVVVLQPGALNGCVDEDDWLRREIEAGIGWDRMLVPVHTPEFDLDAIDRHLPPETAAALRAFNMLEIPPRYFKYAIQELAERFLTPISRTLTPVSAEAQASANAQAAASRAAEPVTVEEVTAEEHLARGRAAVDRGDHQAGLADLDEALRLNPDSVVALLLRATARNALGDPSGAKLDFDEGMRRAREGG